MSMEGKALTPMKSARLVAALCVFAGATLSAWAASGESSVKVNASRALSLAVVDLERGNVGSEALHDAFKEALSAAMSERVKEPTPIKAARVDASRAGWGLGTGVYDVAVVVGGSVPKTMISSQFSVLKAAPQSGGAKRVVTLVMRNEDPGLAQLLAEAFPEAIKVQPFQKALARYSGSLDEGADLKVAGK